MHKQFANMFNTLVSRKELMLYAALFILSYILLILNDGIFWDTWVLYNQSFDSIYKTFDEAGAPFVSYYHVLILDYFGIWGARSFMLLCYFVAGMFLNGVLKQLQVGTNLERIFIVTLFMLVPLNFARISLINHPSAFFYCLFFIAWFCFLRQLDTNINKRLILRLIALCFFYLSFLLNSLLVFYALVVLSFLYWHQNKSGHIIGLIREALKYLDFWLLPLVFYWVKQRFHTPSGLYEGYNQVTFDNVIMSFKYIFGYLENVVISIFALTENSEATALVIIGLSVIIAYFFNKWFEQDERETGSLVVVIAVISVALISLFLAAFPYVVVGKTLTFWDWDSRDQILLPLGFSLLLYAMLRIFYHFISPKLAIYVFSLLIAFFIVKNNQVYYTYLLDTMKEKALLEEFKGSEGIRNNRLFLFVDKSQPLNTLGRVYRFYEWNGLMRYVYGDQHRLGVNANRYKGGNYYQQFSRDSSYNMKDYDFSKLPIPYFVEIDLVDNYEQVLRNMLVAYYFQHKEFESLSLQLLNVKVVKAHQK